MADPPLDWETIKTIVADALELPPEQRPPFVRDACDGNGAMAAEVQALLDGYAATAGMLDSNADAWVGRHGGDMLALSGQRVGRYTLEKLLAEGAMGAVYLARQASPSRQVAIKILRTSLPLLDSVQRFKREAAALGRLSHPNIAQIYESGVHQIANQPGTPYLAMELVDGEPLNRYAVNNRLSREDRIRLMIKVARAVHAAHQQAVIHRDLKPANVLVQGDGEPKVLDFGIARLVDAEDAHATWQTTLGVLVGTPGYMSPEQATGNADLVDVRSDVWSLGVLLYELLAERLPLEVKGRPIPEILRTLESTDPPPLGRIDPSLRGDLETIAATALAKDKSHRYASAEALANDLQNVLQYEPISARPPSPWYRARKLIRRNRLAVGLASLLVVTLVAATAVSTTAFVSERRQRDRAEAVNAFLNDIIGRADPNTGGKDLTVRQVMAQAEALAGTDFAGQPLVEAELRRTIGWTYHQLSDFPAAERNLARSVELFARTLGEDDLQTLRSASHRVSTLRMLDRYDDALALAEQSLASSAASLGRDHALSLELEIARASIYTDRAEGSRAAKAYEELIPRLRRVLGDGHEQVLLAENNFGYLLMSTANYAAAEPVLEGVLRRAAAAKGADNPELFPVRSNLLTTKTGLGKLDECEAEYRSLSADARRVLGEQHRRSIAIDSEFSQLLNLLGKFDESIELQKSVVERSRQAEGADHLSTIKWEMFLTQRLLGAARFAEAEATAREVHARARRVLGEEFLTTLLLEELLARSISGQRRFAEAEPIFRSVIPRTRQMVGDMNNWHANARLSFAKCLNGTGKHDEALQNLLEAQRVSEALKSASIIPAVRREVAQTHILMGLTDDAERLLLEAVEKDKELSSPLHLHRSTAALADLYDRLNRPADAARWRATTQPARNTMSPATLPDPTAPAAN